jgi:PIN domain nuclease of toxin-antitoxin system
VIVLDTHVLVWWVAVPENLSRKARDAVRAAARRRELVASATSIFEIVTASRRGRLELRLPVAEWIASLRQLPELSLHPITDTIAEIAGGFDDAVPGDPADRLITATALSLGSPLVTADERLRGTSVVKTIW